MATTTHPGLHFPTITLPSATLRRWLFGVLALWGIVGPILGGLYEKRITGHVWKAIPPTTASADTSAHFDYIAHAAANYFCGLIFWLAVIFALVLWVWELDAHGKA